MNRVDGNAILKFRQTKPKWLLTAEVIFIPLRGTAEAEMEHDTLSVIIS